MALDAKDCNGDCAVDYCAVTLGERKCSIKRGGMVRRDEVERGKKRKGGRK